ncbi:hypothetical protein BBOMB_1093 [Bifidobacterium bombi DSM 19703]|uniref:Uncharacterized protein n=1 Tax=Bifidobacterium bombi DSM 19703 TaxID=1341695 RepID=A0A080N3T3_9BIFI|nr:hypothetical protein BBOMB_1093 [Bifidobacterium bombi DSM 19703]
MNAPKSPAGHTKILTSGNVSPWRDNPNSPPIGYVAQKVNNPDSGLQAYVLTDEKTGTPPDKVTHVTVLYRGSNEPKDFLNPDRQAAESVLTGKTDQHARRQSNRHITYQVPTPTHQLNTGAGAGTESCSLRPLKNILISFFC